MAVARRKRAVTARPFKLTAPVVREPVLHREIAQVLRLEIAAPGHVSADGVVWWSVDIAAYAGVAPGLRTARGVIAGIPDIIVVYRGCAFFIELKALDGLLSPAQERVAASILLADSRYGVARSADEVCALLDQWAIPHRRRIKTQSGIRSRSKINEIVLGK
jgi:hypothetical protein